MEGRAAAAAAAAHAQEGVGGCGGVPAGTRSGLAIARIHGSAAQLPHCGACTPYACRVQCVCRVWCVCVCVCVCV